VLLEFSNIVVAVRISVTMIRYSLMIPFCWLTGGGDHLRVTEVELISVVTSPSGGTLGTVKELKTITTPGYVVGVLTVEFRLFSIPEM